MGMLLHQEPELFSSLEIAASSDSPLHGEAPAAENLEKFVAFFIGTGIFCILSSVVHEVVHPLPIAPLPNAPSSILGIAAYRGDAVAVINIQAVLRVEPAAEKRKAKLVVLRAEAKDTQFAIPVDSMHELISAPFDSAYPDPASPVAGLTKLLHHSNSVFKLIDHVTLFELLEQSIG